MSELYGTSNIKSIEEAANNDRLLEMFMIDDILSGDSDTIKAFAESQEAQILMEKNFLSKKTLDRATVLKMDLNRRIKLTCYQLAKETNDPNWAKLVKYLGLKKKYANAILKKYYPRAERIAKIAQKNYIKKSKGAAEPKKEEEDK